MTTADFTPVTPEAAAAALDAALFDGAPADERLLDAWATIVAMGERAADLTRVAIGEINHLWEGGCPDAIEGADSRDPGCRACQIIGVTS